MLKYLKETYFKFQCQKCAKWWVVEDAPKTKKTWYCPWCGEKHE